SLVDDRIENAAVFSGAAMTLLRRAGAAEHTLERHARVDFHRQGLRLGGPRDRVHVRAAVTGDAAADIAGKVLRRELERWERRFLAEVLRENLVDRDADADVFRFGLLGDRAAEPAGRADRVVGDREAAGAR